jgi:hypothetical protein
MISAIPAVNHNAVGSSEDDPLGRRPPGDMGYTTYARRYGPPFHECDPSCEHRESAITNAEREDVITAARAELKHLRKTTHVAPESLETPEQTRAKLLDQTEGWSLQCVAQSHWRVSPSMMRKLRIADGRDAESGLPAFDEPEGGEDLASRARRMKDLGMSLRAIGMALGGLHKTQVVRLLAKSPVDRSTA